MLTIHEIQQALHASRVVPLPEGNYHGPLGLKRLAAIVAALGNDAATASGGRVRRALELDAATWGKLDRLARSATPGAKRPVSASQVAAAIIEHYVEASESP